VLSKLKLVTLDTSSKLLIHLVKHVELELQLVPLILLLPLVTLDMS